VIQRRGNTSY